MQSMQFCMVLVSLVRIFALLCDCIWNLCISEEENSIKIASFVKTTVERIQYARPLEYKKILWKGKHLQYTYIRWTIRWQYYCNIFIYTYLHVLVPFFYYYFFFIGTSWERHFWKLRLCCLLFFLFFFSLCMEFH